MNRDALLVSNICIVIYILAWVITLVWYQKKKKFFDAGSIIICSYILFAIASFFLFNNQYMKGEFDDLHLFPFVYLYLMLIIILSPIVKYNELRIDRIRKPSNLLLNSMCVFLIGASLFSLPDLVAKFQDGIIQIVINEQKGAEMYSATIEEAATSGEGISNLSSIISGALCDIGIFCLFYYLTLKDKNKIIIAGLIVSCVIHMVSPISRGQRGGVVETALTILIAFFLFRKFLPPTIRKRILILFTTLVVVISIPFIALTNSRFSERDGGALLSSVNYAGQANLNFNNYGLDAGGIRYGDRTVNLFKRIFYEDTPKNYVERRTKYAHLNMNDDVFYTFVGDFTLDFGPYFTPVIFILFAVFINRNTKAKNRQIFVHQLLLIYFVACICIQGGMTLFTYSDTRNLRIITLIIAIICFKLDYEKQKSMY